MPRYEIKLYLNTLLDLYIIRFLFVKSTLFLAKCLVCSKLVIQSVQLDFNISFLNLAAAMHL